MTLNQQTLDTLVERLFGELSAGYGGVMVSLGDKLGLYQAMAGAGPLSSHEVARRAGCAERYVREWLNSQVAGGYVAYHAGSATYELTPEQAKVLAEDTSPVFLPHAWQVVASMWADEDRAIDAFRTGRGRRLGRSRRAALLRRRGVFPQFVQRQPGQRVAARLGWGRATSSGPAPGSRTSVAATAIRPC